MSLQKTAPQGLTQTPKERVWFPFQIQKLDSVQSLRDNLHQPGSGKTVRAILGATASVGPKDPNTFVGCILWLMVCLSVGMQL